MIDLNTIAQLESRDVAVPGLGTVTVRELSVADRAAIVDQLHPLRPTPPRTRIDTSSERVEADHDDPSYRLAVSAFHRLCDAAEVAVAAGFTLGELGWTRDASPELVRSLAETTLERVGMAGFNALASAIRAMDERSLTDGIGDGDTPGN